MPHKNAEESRLLINPSEETLETRELLSSKKRESFRKHHGTPNPKKST